MSLDSLPPVSPARDYIEAVEKFDALAARDTEIISSPGRSRFFRHGRRTRDAFVFVHGFTNCPQQWVKFATSLHAEGHSVVIPRLPGHGYFFRGTTALARVRAERLLSTVSDAVDVARGAGERVVVAGLSIGGTIAPWVALHRDDVDHVVGIVPFFAVKDWNEPNTALLAQALQLLPNAFVPWEPLSDDAAIPSYGYPHYSTRMLGECLEIASHVTQIVQRRYPIGHAFFGRTTFALNGNEPACNNAVSVRVLANLERMRPGTTRLVVWRDLPANHDVIDPTNPEQRTDLVYPRLREILTRED